MLLVCTRPVWHHISFEWMGPLTNNTWYELQEAKMIWLVVFWLLVLLVGKRIV